MLVFPFPKLVVNNSYTADRKEAELGCDQASNTGKERREKWKTCLSARYTSDFLALQSPRTSGRKITTTSDGTSSCRLFPRTEPTKKTRPHKISKTAPNLKKNQRESAVKGQKQKNLVQRSSTKKKEKYTLKNKEVGKIDLTMELNAVEVPVSVLESESQINLNNFLNANQATGRILRNYVDVTSESPQVLIPFIEPRTLEEPLQQKLCEYKIQKMSPKKTRSRTKRSFQSQRNQKDRTPVLIEEDEDEKQRQRMFLKALCLFHGSVMKIDVEKLSSEEIDKYSKQSINETTCDSSLLTPTTSDESYRSRRGRKRRKTVLLSDSATKAASRSKRGRPKSRKPKKETPSSKSSYIPWDQILSSEDNEVKGESITSLFEQLCSSPDKNTTGRFTGEVKASYVRHCSSDNNSPVFGNTLQESEPCLFTPDDTENIPSNPVDDEQDDPLKTKWPSQSSPHEIHGSFEDFTPMESELDVESEESGVGSEDTKDMEQDIDMEDSQGSKDALQDVVERTYTLLDSSKRRNYIPSLVYVRQEEEEEMSKKQKLINGQECESEEEPFNEATPALPEDKSKWTPRMIYDFCRVLLKITDADGLSCPWDRLKIALYTMNILQGIEDRVYNEIIDLEEMPGESRADPIVHAEMAYLEKQQSHLIKLRKYFNKHAKELKELCWPYILRYKQNVWEVD